LLASDPRDHGQERSRWTLAGLRAEVPEFADASRSGIWRVLRGYRLGWKRARDHLHSPDPTYQEKLAYLATIRTHVDEQPVGAVLLYLDEVTYYRQPSLAAGFAPMGSTAPRAERSTRSNTTTRVIGALNAHTGRVTFLQQTRIGVPALIRFYQQLVAAYPGQRLYVVLDNWPVHFHPDVLAALEPQRSPTPFFRPQSWPAEPRAHAKRLNLPIQLVPLPTYSPWLNYIEKLWRWLKQDVLHLHRSADHLDHLRDQVIAFLSTFAQRSEALLRYVGLRKLPP
jgi:transposase